MRKLSMFLAAIFAAVLMQTTLGPTATASAAGHTGTATKAAAFAWMHWDNYYSEDFCEFMGAMGMLAGSWSNFYCVDDGSEAPWALYVNLN